MSSLAINKSEIDYPNLKLKIGITGVRDISVSKVEKIAISASSELKMILEKLRAKSAVFSDEEILEEIKKWRIEQRK